jgi:hypothetical protein
MASRTRPVALFMLALVPFWPAIVPRARPVESRPAPAVSGEVGRLCTPVLGNKLFRREAARCLMAGQGMWIYEFNRVEGGDPEAIVTRMRRMGISYILIRAGSSRMGFYAQRDLNRILPVAHKHGLKVLVWDFPYFYNPVEDAKRATRELNYTTPTGHRPDGLVPDIEEPPQGVHLSARAVDVYGRELRRRVGPNAIVIATTPRPTPPRVANYPYREVARHFDAIAPMVYWGDEDPEGAVTRAIVRLQPYGLPVIPVGQSYDMRPEGGPGHPSAGATRKFMARAYALGAPGVSFWSWQHAKSHNWYAIRNFSRARIP